MDFPSLRTAGDGLSNIKQRVANAARGLRMPGMTATSNAVLPQASAALPQAPSLAEVNAAAPSMRAPSIPNPLEDMVNKLRTVNPNLPEVPVLTNEVKPVTSMRAPQADIPPSSSFLKAPSAPTGPLPEIPILTDEIKPTRVVPQLAAPAAPIPRSGAGGGMGAGFTYGSTTPPAPMSTALTVPSTALVPSNAPPMSSALTAEPMMRSGPNGGAGAGFTYGNANPPGGMGGAPEPSAGAGSVPPAGAGGMRMPSGPEGWGRAVGSAIGKTGIASRGAALPIIGAGASFAPHWDAFGDDSTLDVGQKAKLMLRDTARAGMGLAGGIAGASLGASAGSVVPVAGTIAGGLAGGIAGGTLAYNAMDNVSGDIRRGLNWANEKMGGSPNYITDTDDDLRKAGFDPSKTAFSMVKDELGGKPVVTPASAAAAEAAAKAAATAAPAVPDDIAAFNKRVQGSQADGGMGAPTVGMRTGLDGPDSRMLFNNVQVDPNSAAGQASAAYQAQRSATQAAADASNGRLAERQQAAMNLKQITDQKFDGSRFDTPLRGEPGGFNSQQSHDPQALAMDRAAAQRDFEAGKAQRASGAVSMRSQDTTSDDARLTQQTAMINGQRAQQNANFEHGMQITKENRAALETNTTQRETAEKDLHGTLGTMFTAKDKDGKIGPDLARVGEAASKIQEEIAGRITQAQKLGRHDLAKEMSERGIAALGPDDRAELMSGLAARDRIKSAHAPNTPGGANFIDGPLKGYKAKKTIPTTFGSDILETENGSRVRANDMRYNELSNSFLPDIGKIPTHDFDLGLGRGMRKEK